MRQQDKAWLAGLIDGEGCIQLTKRARKCRKNPSIYGTIVVSMTHKPTIEHIAILFGNKTVMLGSYKDRRRCLWTAQITTQQAVTLLKQIYPFLVTKKEEADIFLDFYSKFGGQGRRLKEGDYEKQLKLCQQLRDIKQKEYKG